VRVEPLVGDFRQLLLDFADCLVDCFDVHDVVDQILEHFVVAAVLYFASVEGGQNQLFEGGDDLFL